MVVAIQVAGSLVAVFSLGLVLEMPRRYLGWSGLTGGVCWLIYLLVKAGPGPMIPRTFLASLSAALIRHLSARVFRISVSVFLVLGILPLVSGTFIYSSMYYAIRNSREESMYYLVETFQIADVIALAALLMDPVSKLIGKEKRIRV